jgi:hypothetical protein
MPLGCWSISVTLTLQSQFTMPISTSILFIKCGIIFWTTCSIGGKIFALQKKIIKVMYGAQARTSHRSLFKQLQILPVSSIPHQYVLFLSNFIINNHEHFQTHTSVHSIDTRNEHHLHRPYTNLTC